MSQFTFRFPRRCRVPVPIPSLEFTIQNSLFPILSSRGLTKIRTYALISRVRHGATVKGRIRPAASTAGADGKLSWGFWGTSFGRAALLRSRVISVAASPPHHIIGEAPRRRQQIDNRLWKGVILAMQTNTFKSLSNWWTLPFRIASKAFSARLVHLCGKSTQLPCHEQVTHHNGLFRSSPVKPSQGIFLTTMPVNPSLKYYTVPLYIPYYL